MERLIGTLKLKLQSNISRLPYIVVRVVKILFLESLGDHSECFTRVFLLQLFSNTIVLKTPFPSR
jgi:hypothetical protein